MKDYYCSLREGICTHNLCADSPGCDEAADAVLALEPDQFEQAIKDWALKLNLDPELLADFIYSKAFGPGESTFIDPKDPDSPFSGI